MFTIMTTIIPQIFSKFTDYKTPPKNFHHTQFQQPTNSFTTFRYHQQYFRLDFETTTNSLHNKARFDENIKKKNPKRLVLVRFNNLTSNGGGGGRKDDGNKAGVLRNFVLAIGFIYLSLTGKLGSIIDAIVSLWLAVVILLVVGFGALIWWASRDIVRIKCGNCRNEFEVFKSMLYDEPQLCPYCSQPFSVVGDEFVRDRMEFSKESTTFDEAFSDLFSRSKKGKASSRTDIDVEAEVKDAD